MGHSTIFDIISSMIIGGFIVLLIVHLNLTLANSTYTTTNDLNMQTNMTTLVRIIENDFRKIGYCADPLKIADPSKSILSVGLNSIKFVSDIENKGIVDTVYYYLGDTSSARVTPNPRDRILYRVVNRKSPQGYNLGVTKFDFLFYNALGDSLSFPVNPPSRIYSMRLSILLESPYAYDTTYAYSYWRQLRLAARNLRNR
jgi:hypothetical protein